MSPGVTVDCWLLRLVDMLRSPLLLPLILSAGDDTCVSRILAPSANFTGRLKIKQGLPSLPVAQGDPCVCECFRPKTDTSFMRLTTFSCCIIRPFAVPFFHTASHVLCVSVKAVLFPFSPLSFTVPPLGFSDLQHFAVDSKNTTKLSRNSGAENTNTHMAASAHSAGS